MAENPVERAFDAFNAGRKAEAAAICGNLLQGDPLHAPALMLLGLIAEQENRFEDAASLLEKSVGIETHPWSLITLASCLWRLRRLDDSLRYAELAVSRYPDFPDGHLVLANSLHAMRRFDAALIRIREAKILMPQSHLVEARLGCIFEQLGDYEQAMLHFGLAERLMPKFVHCRLIDYRRELWDEIKPGPDVHESKSDPDPTCDTVVATFCDGSYFYKYGATFLNSFACNAARDKRLHLHVLDPPDGLGAFIGELTASTGLANVAVTTESAPLTASGSDGQRKTFYSCARFFHLNRLLEQYQAPVACFDVDTIFEAPIDALLASTAGMDAGLIARSPPDSPWLDIVANIVVANPTAPGRRYFAAVENFIRHFAERGEWFWHLDQIALHCVLKMMERFDTPPRVSWIDQATSSIWHIGHAYDFKLRDGRFTKYQLDRPAAK